MRSRLISRILLSALLLTIFPTLARATVQDRIANAVSGSSRVPLPGTVTGRAKHSTDLGAAPSDQKLNSLSLRFSMTPTQQAALIQLQAAQLNPASPLYHQWLTPEQFGAQFGLSSGDIAKVSTWLTSQGFKITSVARSSTFITFNGTVAQAQSAFGTTIHSLSYNGEQHISNISDPTLPSAIGGVVTSITGLNDFKVKPRSRARNVSVDPSDPSQPRYTQTSCPPSTVPCHYITPADLYTIYDVNPLITAGITGKGITIAIMGQTDIVPTQVAAFRSAAGLPANAPTLMLVPTSTDPGISANDVDEAHIDVEWSGAAAQAATILYVYGNDVFVDSLTYAIDNKVAPIVSTSYGECETGWGTASLSSYNNLLLEANVQGQTVMSASGDAGATDCDSPDVGGFATEGINVDFPASSPYVTAAGGTMFSGDLNTPSTYWNSSNATTGGSVLQYIPEQAWNETTATGGFTAGDAGGGGASAFFAKPAWQTGMGVPNDSSRDTPDISLNAAVNHDGYLVCSEDDGEGETPCASGFLSSSGSPNVFGGTSFVAPIFSGVLAMVEQELGGTPGKGLGNVGPTLYGFLNGPTYTSVFHDITTGNNSVACTQGTLNCPNGGAIGYNAGTGYDQATGIGSFDVNKLVTGWAGVVPVGTGGTIGAGITTTSLTTSAALCGVSSGSLALSIAVTGSITGTTPTGTVQFFVDTVPVSGGSVSLNSSGAATYTLVTSSLSSGGHVISAVYSGDGNYAGSKGTLLGAASNTLFYPNGPLASVDIVSSSSADFSLTPCTGATTAVTVQPGATSTGITLTITPTSGFTGTVTLTVTNNDGMTATPSFSVSPVSITSSAGVTTSFVVLASQVTTTTNAVKARLTFPSGQHPSGKVPWYAVGSGATLACMLLLTQPRRRRWGALLAVVLSVAAFTAVGCSNSSTTGGSGGTTPPVGTVTNASPGVYSFTITAVSGSIIHSTQATVTVPCPDGTLDCLTQ